MKTYFLPFLWAMLLGLLAFTETQATHLRAGEITTRRISNTSLTYEVTMTTYHDEIGGKTASDQQDPSYFCFGIGPAVAVKRASRIVINRATTANTYVATYTYPGPGIYRITCTITNRNENVRNIPTSIQTSFQLQTTIVVNAALGLNSTPVLLNPPLDSARVGQKWCHNPAAYDADGDSLAYRLYVPSGKIADEQGNCTIKAVSGYSDPTLIGVNRINEAGTGPATLTVNAITGDVCWDAPAEQGQYNIAFIVEEWRDGVKIGEIIRDMQIIVTASPNKRPAIVVPDDICVEAGTLIQRNITATDPDGNRVELSAYGGPFNISPDGKVYNPAIIAKDYATFAPVTAQNTPATGTFRWQTNCAHVRGEPYDVVFRVVDLPRGSGQTQLATLESFRIKIFAPKPQNLTARPAADAAGRAIILNWAAYACGSAALPANTKMAIYRKEGCDQGTFDPCATPGQLAAQGYSLIDTVGISRTTYTDNNKNQGLKRGVQYSYRIVVTMPSPNNGQSAVSEQVCVNLPQQVPLITHVTVDSTYDTRGVITVRWTRPPGINPQDGTGPFQYRLFRATGLTGTNFTQIAAINTTLSPTVADTVYTDRGLNTVANAYRYRIEFFFTDPGTGQLQRLDVTDNASSVRLTATGGLKRVQLSWQANVPWSNDNKQHRVYRSKTGPNGPFNLVAVVPVTTANTYVYTDLGTDTYAADGVQPVTMSVDSSYCYRVETIGQYSAPLTTIQLNNFSQGICAMPVDTTKPCPPILAVDTLNCAALTPESFCNQTTFANNLTWQNPTTGDCDRNIVKYNIYYSPCEGQEPTLLASVNAPTMTYRHENLTSFAGCYEVKAVSRSGQESKASNRVCKDNCPYLNMPNVFTPNGDGKNDVFQPMNCPRFVQSAELTVVNRWGVKVYQSSDVSLKWNGKNSQGKDVPGGVYLYQVTVKFARVNCSAPAEVYKGWVELLREAGAN
ncbi:T9SS type B sorting domain-containing protein [Larkinella rosea]|uniref:Gliding motility-associated C-terminal domain-containing protein n=1 Tax=Larkinella rosea TaxID=2025312 RepID=A0A3P1BZV9_9BACT|nr:gliding motility-associated C-terminal domain-containing protein [Larkinella rosea]RRB06528.1 gliding motility-associated C-terminal domain-containing protein [Larkinella rosea]